MKFEDCKVDMIVKIREWNDMLNEFPINDQGEIHIKNNKILFAKGMRHLCGRKAVIIERFLDFKADKKRIVLNFFDKSGDISWQYSPEMVCPLFPGEE